jgi:broad specificity phosphatase PhoE
MLHQNTHIVFHFVRHGESELNRQPRLIGGRSETTPLSSRGEDQSRRLGARLRDEGTEIDLFFSSPLPRAQETTRHICEGIGYPVDQVETVGELTELSQGLWEGQNRDEIYSAERLRYINTKGPLFTPPEGESQRMVERRVSSWLEDRVIFNPQLVQAKPILNVMVVSHALTLKCLFHYILGFNDRLTYRVQLDNCSLSRFVFKQEGWFVHSLNDSYHLADIGRSSGEYTGL